jgi:hypothetical protein
MIFYIVSKPFTREDVFVGEPISKKDEQNIRKEFPDN